MRTTEERLSDLEEEMARIIWVLTSIHGNIEQAMTAAAESEAEKVSVSYPDE